MEGLYRIFHAAALIETTTEPAEGGAGDEAL
jgi:hypothetical protein